MTRFRTIIKSYKAWNKILMLISLLFLFLPTMTWAADTSEKSWQTLGDSKFAETDVSELSMATDKNNTAYVCYSDRTYKIFVKKFDPAENKWISVGGTDFFGYEAKITVSQNGTPYVVYKNKESSRAIVKKCEGENWVTVGNTDFSKGLIGRPSIVIDCKGIPYVSYCDYYSQEKATVMKYDDNRNQWIVVGNDGFSESQSYSPSLGVDNYGIPYVALQNNIMRYDAMSNVWTDIGPDVGIDMGTGRNSIAFDSKNNLYVTGVIDGEAAVLKYDSSTGWVNIGSINQVSDSVLNVSLAIGQNDAIYVLQLEGDYYTNIYHGYVRKYDGSNWAILGGVDAGISAIIVREPSMILDNSGIPYVAYISNVMKYADSKYYQVIYDGNGSDSGNTPLDRGNYLEKAKVTVKNNTGNLVRNSKNFIGWNTKADGSGITYVDGDNFIIENKCVTLYAKWGPPFTVTYNDNGSLNGTAPVDRNTYSEGDTVTVFDNSGKLVKKMLSFYGWNTQADGKGLRYLPGNTFVMPNSDIILYAQYAPY